MDEAVLVPSLTVIVYVYTLLVSESVALSKLGVADHVTVRVPLEIAHAKSSASAPDSAQVRVPEVSVSVIEKLSMLAVLPSATEMVVEPAV